MLHRFFIERHTKQRHDKDNDANKPYCCDHNYYSLECHNFWIFQRSYHAEKTIHSQKEHAASSSGNKEPRRCDEDIKDGVIHIIDE